MVKAVFMFLGKVLTVVGYIGILIMPFYLLAAFVYAIYKDYFCSNKRKKW